MGVIQRIKEFFKPEVVEITRTYKAPVTTPTVLGSIPEDWYDWCWGFCPPYGTREYHKCDAECHAGPVQVVRDVPQYEADGSPKKKEVTETLREAVYSPRRRGAGLATLGTAAGVGGALLAARALGGAPLGAIGLAVLGAALGGTIGGLFGYHTAKGDKVNEVWETRDISHPRMVGYTHEVTPDIYYETYCHRDSDNNEHCYSEPRVRGYWHEHDPDLTWKKVGEYQAPTLQHLLGLGPGGAGAITALAAGVGGALVPLLASAASGG